MILFFGINFSARLFSAETLNFIDLRFDKGCVITDKIINKAYKKNALDLK